ncbi:MAG: hypothetical protein AB1679_12155 [Actinomycetota bacterium]
MATRADISAADDLFLREDKDLVFTVTTSTGGTQDVTGWTLVWKLERAGSTADVLTKSTGAGLVLTTPASGVITVTLNSTDTAALAAGSTYRHALRRTDAGEATVLSYGTVTLRDAVR